MVRYALVLVIGLTGCGLNPAYMQAKQDDELARHTKSCETLGYSAGSQQARDCALRLYELSRGASTVTVRGGS